MKITCLPPVSHIGAVVSDLEKAVAELSALYGASGFGSFYDFIPRRCFIRGKEIADCQIRICMVDWTDQLKLELLQPISGATEHARFLETCGGGLHHSAYCVDDYDAYRAFICSAGFEIIFETETEDARGYRRCLYALLEQSNLIIEILENARLRK